MSTTPTLPAGVRGRLLCGPPSGAAARRRWLEERRNGLGASEVSTILGLAPDTWGTSPLSVWLEKTDPEHVPDEPTERMVWGLRLERPIADEYRTRHAKAYDVYVAPSPGLLASEDHPWLRCTPDRLLLDRATRTSARGLLEIKTAAAQLARDWRTGVPLYYQVQAQVQMGITGLPWCDVVPLLGGNTMPEPYRLEFDALAYAQIVEVCSAWWDEHIVSRVPPEPLLRDLPLLPEVWPGDGSSADITSGLADRLRLRTRIKARIKALEEAAGRVELDLKRQMKDATTAWDPQGNKVATWTRYERTGWDAKRFKADHPNLAQEYTTKTPSQRLTVHRLAGDTEEHDDE